MLVLRQSDEVVVATALRVVLSLGQVLLDLSFRTHNDNGNRRPVQNISARIIKILCSVMSHRTVNVYSHPMTPQALTDCSYP